MKFVFAKILRKNTDIFLSLVALDVLVVALHLTLGRYNQFFHLDFEQNLPTVYQSTKLLLFGSGFFLLGFSKRIPWEAKSFIWPLSAFLIFLGLDELLQMHENIYRIFEFFPWLHPSKIVDASMKLGYRSSLWILYYLPFIFIFVFWRGYWLRYFQSHMRKNAWILVLSSLCLFLVLAAEILSSTGTYSETGYYWLVTLEETSEMLLASTLVLVGGKMLGKQVRGTQRR